MPRVLNKRTDKIPSTAKYIGRPSKWGNLFRIGMWYQGRLLDRRGAVEAHKDWLLYSDEGQKLLADIDELRGFDLVCWCHTWDGKGANPMYCHGDTLLELANE